MPLNRPCKIQSLLTLAAVLLTPYAHAAVTLAPVAVQIEQLPGSPHYPVLVPGRALTALHGIPIEKITAYVQTSSTPALIPFQIDRRNENGQYQIEQENQQALSEELLTANHELVFMAGDAGPAGETAPPMEFGRPAVRIELGVGELQRAVYLAVTETRRAPRSPLDYAHYDAATDSVQTSMYRMGFAAQQPFLVDSLRWVKDDAGNLSENITDTMKVRHRGKLFGQVDFLRTEADYRSRLLAVKDGPVRVIRQTRNQVRILWQLRSPSIDIDYINYANHIVMDTLLDFPFPIGWFFNDVVTVASMDLSGQPRTRLYHPQYDRWMDLDGAMSDAEEHYNSANLENFILATPGGWVLGTLYLTETLPIGWHTWLTDDRTQRDPPENIAGQFGNIGFFTDQWELVDMNVHHLYYSFFLIPPVTVGTAMNILEGAPQYGKNTH